MPVRVSTQCDPCIAAADAKANLVSDVTGTSKYTFEKTPWSVPINVNAKEGWAAAGVQMGTIAIGYEKVPGRNGYYYMPAGTPPPPFPTSVLAFLPSIFPFLTFSTLNTA